jgi:hypothetical protein
MNTDKQPTLNERFFEAIEGNLWAKYRGYPIDIENKNTAANACEKIALSYSISCQIELLENIWLEHDGEGGQIMITDNGVEIKLENKIESLTKQLKELK